MMAFNSWMSLIVTLGLTTHGHCTRKGVNKRLPEK